MGLGIWYVDMEGKEGKGRGACYVCVYACNPS